MTAEGCSSCCATIGRRRFAEDEELDQEYQDQSQCQLAQHEALGEGRTASRLRCRRCRYTRVSDALQHAIGEGLPYAACFALDMFQQLPRLDLTKDKSLSHAQVWTCRKDILHDALCLVDKRTPVRRQPAANPRGGPTNASFCSIIYYSTIDCFCYSELGCRPLYISLQVEWLLRETTRLRQPRPLV